MLSDLPSELLAIAGVSDAGEILIILPEALWI